MSKSKTAQIGPGRFQWSFGSWFGSVLGGSAWMLATAIFMIGRNQPELATIPLACFVGINLISIYLWLNRHRIQPFHGLMTLFLVLALTIPFVWLTTLPSSVFMNYFVCLLVPITMIRFYFLEQRAQAS